MISIEEFETDISQRKSRAMACIDLNRFGDAKKEIEDIIRLKQDQKESVMTFNFKTIG